MTTATQKRTAGPAAPTVQLIRYSLSLGVGIVRINNRTYNLQAIKDNAGQTIGVNLSYSQTSKTGKVTSESYDIDLFPLDAHNEGKPVNQWFITCECKDAIFHSERECKHRIAVKAILPEVRQMRKESRRA